MTIIIIDAICITLAALALLLIPAIAESRQRQAFNNRMKRLALLQTARGNSAYGQDRYIRYNKGV